MFADTGWEHPKTYEYLRVELTRVLGPIHEVRAEKTLPEYIRQWAMFPSRVTKFCTRVLKIEPLAAYVRSFGCDVVNVVGVRAEESARRAMMAEWEYADGFDCDVWRPIIDWSEADVIAIHKRHGLAPNPLYLMGASRVGCWPCIHARKEEIRMIADIDPSRIDEIRELERVVGDAVETKNGGAQALAAKGHHRPSFFHGHNGDTFMPIDQVVRWARTARGGRQYELFADRNDGCARWGMCERSDDPTPR